ncbi:Uncharacterised protein [Vibrio cholerae]|nr:Uncharacterised protein [Vibrio cholerae]CSA45509.1 Uncharacterised protein [Vibrio cholerae]CSA56685.1 Uncharacterised protein [Vibrio cholerae]CSB48822.1 Uncharacterised protein [Vibrio cholerae]CSI65489.1 Uncharacterised protein [Vibrio cholerae]
MMSNRLRNIIAFLANWQQRRILDFGHLLFTLLNHHHGLRNIERDFVKYRVACRFIFNFTGTINAFTETKTVFDQALSERLF